MAEKTRTEYRREIQAIEARMNAGETVTEKEAERVRKYKAAMKRQYDQGKLKKNLANVQHDIEEGDPAPATIPARPVHREILPDFGGIGKLSDRQKRKVVELLMEMRDREYETLKLYRPMPVQGDFHMSDAHIRILRGGNRSGKTSACLAELAWAMTGQHPVKGRYPERDGRAIVVAKNVDKIGEVIWRNLGRPGAFKCVDDQETGNPRMERPGDREAGLKMRPSPPMIPQRFIDSVSWYSKKANQPSKLVLKNGWECNFYSSEADPFSIQGTKLDLVHFDEEVANDGWLPEALARLLDRGGRLMWSATPQTGTQKLYDLYLKAQEEQELGVEKPMVEEFVISIWDNPYISEADKQLFLSALDDDDQIKVRIEGEHAVAGFKIYGPTFFPRGVHGIAPFPVPHDWTRFAAIDPGVQVAAVVFAACPPPRKPAGSELDESLFGDFVYIYDEIYFKRCDAAKLAAEMRRKIGDQVMHTVLIDHHGGQLTEIGSGLTPEQQYKNAFKAAKVPMPLVGRYFTWGSDDLNGGIMRVKEFLRVRGDGTPKLRILSGTCPNLISSLSRYQWKVVQGVMTDKPMQRNVDLCDSLRYLCMHPGVSYQKTAAKEKVRKTAYEQFEEFRDREMKRKKKTTGVQL